MDDRVRVKIKTSGLTGTVPRSQFNPAIHEEIGGAGQVQTPSMGGTVGAEQGTQGGAQTGVSMGIPAVGGGQLQGFDMDKLHMLLGLMAAGKGQYGTASSIFARTKETASDIEKNQQIKQANQLSKQMDGLLKDWDKLKWYERLPVPGINRISPQRSKYENLRSLYNVQLILMWEDKRITDEQRKIFEKFFPEPLMTKGAAKERVNAIKQIVGEYAQVVSPHKYQNQQQTTDLNQLFQYLE